VLAEPVNGTPVPVPPLVTSSWNGSTGVDLVAERWRAAVADVAQLSPEPQVRDAALAALATGDPAVIQKFATVDKRALETQVAAAKRKTAADNLAKIKAMAGTGGPAFNAEVQRVLAGTDGDREAFLAYGADVARSRDEKAAAGVRERAAQLRERLRVFAAAAPAESQLKAAAEQALAGDDAAVAAFWETGYLAAAKADAQAREQYLRDLEARNKAAEDLSELAQRAKRASEARTRLLAAHGDGVRALQRASNAMAGAANAARHSQRVLAGSGTAAAKATELTAAKTQTANDLRAAQQAAEQAQAASAIAVSAADTLVETGLTYGAEWSLIAQGMSEAATAALGAATTAGHAIDATIATNNAQDAQAKAEAHAKQAEQWRKHAQQHAAAAAKLAAAAKRQADAAKTAAARTKAARVKAEAAEAKAWAAAQRAREQRQIAEAQAAEAKRQRQIAEAERANAARYRAEAEQQAAAARSARANADAQAAIASGARVRAEDADRAAGAAEGRAWSQEGAARQARDAALAAERAEQTAKAKEQALRARAAATAGGAEKDEAQRQADEAGRQSGVAGNAARSARGSANAATGAATNARAAATQAQQAAGRAWAAAHKARAAADAADAAADKAEAAAKATHAARVRADAQAAVATAQEAKAAAAANAAQRLAGQAGDEAVQSLWAADRTKAEAEAAITEAVAAAAQAEIAVHAAAAASASAAGIAQPANTAIGMVSPFTGTDLDADFVKLVAEQAKAIGAEQAAAAKARADEAITAAQAAEAAADRAEEQVKPAYLAAAQAARSAAEAARSAAEAKQAAAQAAADGAAARDAAAGAGRADAQARADAAAARQAANEAAGDAAIAERSAQAAQNDADAANSAATAAESDAAAARGAADRAEADAAKAERAAANAQKHADSAATAAGKALEHAVEAEKAAARAEEAERKRAAEAAAESGAPAPVDPELLKYLTPEEQQQLREAQELSAQGILDFLKDNAYDLFMDLSGLGDIKSCIMDGNIEACLWTLVGMLPVGKIFGAMADLAKLLPKVLKFVDKINDARKRLDNLIDVAKSKLKKATCPVPVKKNSFLPGTQVLLVDGGHRAIEDLRVGDQVLATDPVTGTTAAKTVTDTITGVGDKELVDVTVDAGGSRTASITATGNHPFWVPELSEWVDAADLSAGQWLRTSAGTTVRISAVRHRTAHARVHNITVADLHTYYVLAGQTPVLVHNTGPFGCGVSGSDLGNYQPIHGLDPHKVADLKKLSDEDLLKSFNDPADGGYALVTKDGRIMNGHHRIAELQQRIKDGRIPADTRVRIDEYRPELPDDGFWD